MSATPATVGAGGSVTVDVHLTNPNGGVLSAGICYALPNGSAAPGCQGPQIGPETLALSLFSGTAADGVWRGSVQVPPAAASGTWTVQFLNTTAVDGFKGFGPVEPLFAGGSFTVNGGSDITPPTIALASLAPLTVPSGGTVTVVAHITDASGVAAASIQTLPSTASTIFVPLSLLSGTPQDGMWQVNLVPTTPGIYNLTAIAAQDTAGNFGQISAPPNLGSFTVTGATDPGLGSAGTFAVLAGTVIGSTGPSWITGRMALFPGSSVTGFPPATSGPQDIADGAALQARTDATTAYNNAAAETPFTTLSADLGGMTLVPGIYRYSSSAGLTGTVTLNGGGIYIFQIGSTITTASSSRVLLINGAQPCDIFWQIGSSATIGGSTAFVGTILAHNNITMVTAATLNGRALAGVGPGGLGAVLLDTNRIIQPSGCSGGFTTSYPPPAFVPPPVGNILPGTLGDDLQITAVGMNISAAEGQAFSGTVATFNDGDASSSSAEYAATIAWGDGSSTSPGAISGPTGGPFTVSGSHIYAEERSYNATVTITDTDTTSNTTTAGFTAAVADAALTGQPVCPATIQSNFAGATATFADANPGAHLDDFTALINWGDGHSSAGVITGTNPYTVSGTHVYTVGGPHIITTSVTDVGGSTVTLSCLNTRVSCDQEGDNEGQFECRDPEPHHHGHHDRRDLQLEE